MKSAEKRHQRRTKKRAAKKDAESNVVAAAANQAGPSFHSLGNKRITVEVSSEVSSKPTTELLSLWWSSNSDDRRKVSLAAIIDSIQNFERTYLEISRISMSNGGPVSNPGLIDIWKNYSTFVVAPVSAEEAGWGHLCFSEVNRPHISEPRDFVSLKTHLKGCGSSSGSSSMASEPVKMHCNSSGQSSSVNGVAAMPDSVQDLICSYTLTASVVDKETFLHRFSVFTSRQFEGWTDWDNMLVIGGAIVACLSPLAQEPADLHNYYFSEDDRWTSSDIDVYFFDLSDQEFGAKVFKLYQHLLKRNGKVAVLRTPFTVTFVSDYPARNIQIVLGKWWAPAQVLMEPDIDCSAVGFDGSRVWATERSRMSYNHRWLLATEERYQLRGFPEYEERLYKYSRRGFAIVDRELEGDFSNVSEKYMNIGRVRLMEHKVVRGRTSVNGLRLMILAARDAVVRAEVDLFKIDKYKESGIPYGPEWDVDKVCAKMMDPVYETTHYGPSQVESRFIVLKPEAETADGKVPLNLSVLKPAFQQQRWFYDEEDRKKAAEEDAHKQQLPATVATEAYFTNEIKLVNMEVEEKSGKGFRRWRPNWHSHMFKYQEEEETAKELRHKERVRARFKLQQEQYAQCLKEGYCTKSVRDPKCRAEGIEPIRPELSDCTTCNKTVCRSCNAAKCHGPACGDAFAKITPPATWSYQCQCFSGCLAKRDKKYEVPRNLDYATDEERRDSHSDSD